MSILIAYYSRKGENYVNGQVENLKKGNTEIVAEFIQKAVGGDLFEIDTVTPYSANYYECINDAQMEQREDARPEIKKYVEDMSKYHTIFVGYPNWWGQMPMCMCTFLEHYDFTGKRIIPFCTHEGSGMGQSEMQILRLCKGANIYSGLAIHGAEAAESEEEVASWAKLNIY